MKDKPATSRTTKEFSIQDKIVMGEQAGCDAGVRAAWDVLEKFGAIDPSKLPSELQHREFFFGYVGQHAWRGIDEARLRRRMEAGLHD